MGQNLTDEEVVGRARNFAHWNKTSTYSASEFNQDQYYAEQSLLKDGATAAQLELFRKIVQDAPIRGGRFNPYSGD